MNFPHRSYSFDRDGRANGHDASASLFRGAGVNAARIGGGYFAANYAPVANTS